MEILGVLAINALNFMVPILLATVGEIVTERSGVVNIGLEGILNMAAFVATAITYLYGDPWTAFILGTLAGTALGLIHAFVSTYLRGDQIVSGIGLNMVSYGACVLGMIAVWKYKGYSPRVETLPVLNLGKGFILSPFAPIAVAIAVGIWFLLNRTRIGLAIRACGEDSKAAEAMGIKVLRTRFLATIFGSFLTAIGGAYISLGILGTFTQGIAAGRGFIALTNVAFSGWNPLIAILGAYIFGFLDSLAQYLPTVIGGVASITYAYPIQTLPYVGTLIIVSTIRWRARIPRELGKPYIKE